MVLTLCYLGWWSFLTPTSAFTLLAHMVLHSVTCTGGLFLPPTTYHIYSTATCGGPIVTCTVWWGWWWWLYVAVVYIHFSYLGKMINSSKYNIQCIATHVYVAVEIRMRTLYRKFILRKWRLKFSVVFDVMRILRCRLTVVYL